MGLFNSTVLDVAIGLVFIYLLLAILCTAANEWLAGLTKMRAKFLRKGLMQLLDSQPTGKDGSPRAFINEFYLHPIVTGIMKDGSHPAYLSPRSFTAVMLDLLADKQGGVPDPAKLPEGDVKKALLALTQYCRRERKTLGEGLEEWFNDAMDRVSGWYKRRTQFWTIMIALVITIVANADTIHISRKLLTDPVLRSAVVEEAKVRAQKPPPSVTIEYPDPDDPTAPQVTNNDEGNVLSEKERDQLGQLIGWHSIKDDTKAMWAERVFGWLLTVLALSLGAPFWFDVLNKFINIRSAGKSPDEKAKGPEKENPANA